MLNRRPWVFLICDSC